MRGSVRGVQAHTSVLPQHIPHVPEPVPEPEPVWDIWDERDGVAYLFKPSKDAHSMPSLVSEGAAKLGADASEYVPVVGSTRPSSARGRVCEDVGGLRVCRDDEPESESEPEPQPEPEPEPEPERLKREHEEFVQKIQALEKTKKSERTKARAEEDRIEQELMSMDLTVILFHNMLQSLRCDKSAASPWWWTPTDGEWGKEEEKLRENASGCWNRPLRVPLKELKQKYEKQLEEGLSFEREQRRERQALLDKCNDACCVDGDGDFEQCDIEDDNGKTVHFPCSESCTASGGFVDALLPTTPILSPECSGWTCHLRRNRKIEAYVRSALATMSIWNERRFQQAEEPFYTAVQEQAARLNALLEAEERAKIKEARLEREHEMEIQKKAARMKALLEAEEKARAEAEEMARVKRAREKEARLEREHEMEIQKKAARMKALLEAEEKARAEAEEKARKKRKAMKQEADRRKMAEDANERVREAGALLHTQYKLEHDALVGTSPAWRAAESLKENGRTARDLRKAKNILARMLHPDKCAPGKRPDCNLRLRDMLGRYNDIDSHL